MLEMAKEEILLTAAGFAELEEELKWWLIEHLLLLPVRGFAKHVPECSSSSALWRRTLGLHSHLQLGAMCMSRRVWLFATAWTVARQAPLFTPGKYTGEGCHFLLRDHPGISLTGDWTCTSCVFYIGRQVRCHRATAGGCPQTIQSPASHQALPQTRKCSQVHRGNTELPGAQAAGFSNLETRGTPPPSVLSRPGTQEGKKNETWFRWYHWLICVTERNAITVFMIKKLKLAFWHVKWADFIQN